MTRKSPEQRAAEVVSVLERRLERIQRARMRLSQQDSALLSEEEAVSARLDYARANPDLE